ncbi:unnamed protein product [Microthlaspi erraticum]|uniref:SHSP domain-containing protein n=1 Tax=Microthlaspi erraticum TaxID=1685480 RepID=A0A6D2JNA0_9BRAS|nr:unnamed protein product [Microthlaspi erraticum]CAA7045345.1 unnamed protein product [Microthlaspi erraticum]
MKVHALPSQGNNILIHHHPTREPGKKLRRLPHIFSRVLELPLSSDADVSVEERLDCFRFVAETDGGGVKAYVVEIHPGVTKILVRTNGSSSLGLSLDELDLDVWRFRLPESTRLDLVTVDCDGDGELIVTVPKIEDDGRDFPESIGTSNRIVLVQ